MLELEVVVNEIFEAQKALQEYSATQEQLCSALFKEYGPAEDRFLMNVPSSGLLTLDGQVWRFKKHGVGVVFEQLSDRTLVDAHQHIEVCPTCFDVWRLVQYFESKGIHSLNIGSKIYNAQDEHSLAEMLAEFVEIGEVVSRSEIEAFALVPHPSSEALTPQGWTNIN
jgi:hypothetical protein